MHPTLPMIEAQISDSRSRVDIAYMHRNLTIVGLPIRRPAPHAGNTAEFHRKGPGFDLTLLTQDARIQDGEIDTVVPIGVPWGTKPRLLIMWLASALQKNPHQRFVEIGPIKEWLASIGVPATGEAHDSTKAQTVKLCHTIFTVSVNGIDQDGDKAVGRIATSLVEESIFKHEDLLHFKAGRYGDIKWPTGLMLTERAAMQFDQQLIPIPVKYLREIANNATAIDLFLYLSYRLPLIPEGKTQLISWKQLSLQFGPSPSLRPAKFRENFARAINASLKAYPAARVEELPEGLLLHHSDPVQYARAFISMSDAAEPAFKKKLLRNRIVVRGPVMN